MHSQNNNIYKPLIRFAFVYFFFSLQLNINCYYVQTLNELFDRTIQTFTNSTPLIPHSVTNVEVVETKEEYKRDNKSETLSMVNIL
jgi:hypothetical protein